MCCRPLVSLLLVLALAPALTAEDLPEVWPPGFMDEVFPDVDGPVPPGTEHMMGLPTTPPASRGCPGASLPDPLPEELRKDGIRLAVRLEGVLVPTEEQVRDCACIVATLRARHGEYAAPTHLPWVEDEMLLAQDEGQPVLATVDPLDTGHEGIDALNARFKVVEISPSMGGFKFRFEEIVDVDEVAVLYRTLPGLDYVVPNYWYGQSVSTSLARTEDGGWLASFSVGSGDCPAGCIDWKTSRYRFNADLELAEES